MAFLQAARYINTTVALAGCSIGFAHLYKERAKIGRRNLAGMMAFVLSSLIFLTIFDTIYLEFLQPYRTAYLINISISITTFVLVACHMMTPIKYFVSIYPFWTPKVVYRCQIIFAFVEFVFYLIDLIIYVISPNSFIHLLLFIVIKSTTAVTCLAVLFTLSYISSKFAFQAIFKDIIRTQVLNQHNICLNSMKVLIVLFISAIGILLWASIIDTKANDFNLSLNGSANVFAKAVFIVCFVLYERVYKEVKVLVAIGIEVERKRIKLGVRRASPGSIFDFIGTRSKTPSRVDAKVLLSDVVQSPSVTNRLGVPKLSTTGRNFLSCTSSAIQVIFPLTQTPAIILPKICETSLPPEISPISPEKLDNADEYVQTVLLQR